MIDRRSALSPDAGPLRRADVAGRPLRVAVGLLVSAFGFVFIVVMQLLDVEAVRLPFLLAGFGIWVTGGILLAIALRQRSAARTAALAAAVADDRSRTEDGPAPDPRGDSPTSSMTFQRRPLALVNAVLNLVWSCLFVAVPVAFATAFVVLGAAAPFAGVQQVTLVPIGVAAIFVLGGLPTFLEAVARIQLARARMDGLVVDANGISMAGMGRLSWSEIAEVRLGQVDVVQSRGTHRRPRRLEIVPRDRSRLADRPWSARALDGYRGWWQRRIPGGTSALPGAFGLGLDQLDARPAEVLDQIDRCRAYAQG